MIQLQTSGALSRIIGQIRTAASSAGDVIYPPICLNCSVMTGARGGLCTACWAEVRFIERPFCEITGVPFDHDRGEGMVSAAAIADPPSYGRARAAVLHDGAARKLAHGLKYADRTDLAPTMATWMVRAGRELLAECDAVLSVPLHRRRLMARNYNQAGELARAIAEMSGKTLVSGVLVRNKPTLRQVGLGRKARIENLRGAFAVDPNRRGEIAGLNVLLVDDVLTTGATVNASARVLMRAGASRVDVLTFARVASEGAETLYA